MGDTADPADHTQEPREALELFKAGEEDDGVFILRKVTEAAMWGMISRGGE